MAITAQKVGPKFQVTIPKKVRDALGIKAGDLVETSLTREGAALIRPVVLVHRKVDLDKRFEAAEADVKAGRTVGPFKTARAAMNALNKRVHARRVH
ncbi:MAG: AbrB/MazE/SpoVT family DNA-binding domain-containing protein [Deltaproteobacteria bacterium]|nr:AbrB/MazE/SpoVT family DNA-binding domain-containing protein [Deltaproteobacteria bacterium]